MKRIGLLACAGMLVFLGIANAQDNAPQIKTFQIRNVRSGMVAWWIDPANNKEPVEITASKNATEWSRLPGEVGSTPLVMKPDSVMQVIDIGTQNVVLGYGTPASLEELGKVISQLDRPQRNIEIQAQFISLTNEAEKSLVAEFPETKFEAGQTRRVFQKLDAAKVQKRLQELIDSKQARIINAPRVTGLNNLTARMTTTGEVPAVIGYKGDDEKFHSVFESSRTGGAFELGLGYAMNLLVTPTIQNDDTISLNLRPTKTLIVTVPTDDIISRFRDNKGVLPVKTLDNVSILANVQDGETIAMVGFPESFFDIGLLRAQHEKKPIPELKVMFLLTAHIIRRNAERVATKSQK